MTTATTEKTPSHEVFRVTGEGDKAYWTRVGAAWQHKDGKGFSLKFDALPIEGRIVVRPKSKRLVQEAQK